MATNIVDIEASIKVVIKDMARSVDMGPSVDGELEHGEISNGAILHALCEPEELPNNIGRIKRRHIRVVLVADVDTPAISVSLSPRWATREPARFTAVYGWVGGTAAAVVVVELVESRWIEVERS